MKAKILLPGLAAALLAVTPAFADGEQPEPPAAPSPAPSQPKRPFADAKGSRERREGIRDMVEQFKGQHQGGQEMDFGGMKRVLDQNLSEEERQKLRRLAFDNPDSFRDEMKKKFTSFNQRRQEECKKLAELQKSYREASTPEAKKEAEEQIRAFSKDQFTQKMEMNKRRLEEAERNVQDAAKRLEDYRKRYEERNSRAADIIEERVKELTKDPALEWRD